MQNPMRPMPVLDADSTPFWEGCREHRLRLQKCSNCSTPRYPARRHCAACGSDQSEWFDASGKATVFSWIVVRHPVPKEVFADEVPYVVALLDLEEGVRMASNIVGIEPEQVQPDMAVQVTYQDRGEVVLPVFEPQKG